MLRLNKGDKVTVVYEGEEIEGKVIKITKAGNFKVRHEGFYFRLPEEHTFYPNGLVYGSKKHKWNAMYIERVI